VGKLSDMPGFLVATRLQNLCGEPNQLAKVLRDEDGKEAQIPGTKNALWAGIFRHPRTATRRSLKTSSTGRCKAVAACCACSIIRSGKVSVMVVMDLSAYRVITPDDVGILAQGACADNGQGDAFV